MLKCGEPAVGIKNNLRILRILRILRKSTVSADSAGFVKVNGPQSIVHSGIRVGIELVFSSRQWQWAVGSDQWAVISGQ